MEQIAAARLVPVLRADSANAAVSAAERLLSHGLNVIELTATTPDWPEALTRLRRDYPKATIGMGTVTSSEDARRALDLGAEFLVSPWPVEQVRRVAAELGAPFLEGGFTPAEIAAASKNGVAKLFPAHVGGVAYLKSLLAVLPAALIMPTGGIKLDEVGRWLAAGAFAVGVGSELAKLPAERIREVLDGL